MFYNNKIISISFCLITRNYMCSKIIYSILENIHLRDKHFCFKKECVQ